MLRKVPATGPRYWAGLCAASVFGANLGDFVSHDLHLGHVRGLPILAVAFAAILWAARRSRSGAAAYYWLAIVTLRTAATNLADLGTHDLRLGYGGVIAALSVLLLGVVSRCDASAPGVMPRTNAAYWLAMLLAGTLGTALGDAGSEGLGLGAGPASVVFGLVLAAALVRRWPYWAIVVAVRTAGTTMGDLIADNAGLPLSTLGTGLILLATLLIWKQTPAMRVNPEGGENALLS